MSEAEVSVPIVEKKAKVAATEPSDLSQLEMPGKVAVTSKLKERLSEEEKAEKNKAAVMLTAQTTVKPEEESILDSIGSSLSTMVDKAVDTVAEIKNSAVEAAGGVAKFVKEDVIDEAGSLFTSSSPSPSDGKSGGAPSESEGIIDTITEAISDAAHTIGDGVSSAYEAVTEGLSDAAEFVGEKLGVTGDKSLMDSLGQELDSVMDSLSSMADSVGTWIGDTFDGGVKLVESVFDTDNWDFSAVRDFFSLESWDFGAIGDAFSGWDIGGTIDSITDSVGSFFSNCANDFSSAFESVSSAVSSFVGDLFETRLDSEYRESTKSSLVDFGGSDGLVWISGAWQPQSGGSLYSYNADTVEQVIQAATLPGGSKVALEKLVAQDRHVSEERMGGLTDEERQAFLSAGALIANKS
ncbi:MAG: hypothetical protein PHC51_09420 [bacterium]|nr:hypothetical protein [bacterium]